MAPRQWLAIPADDSTADLVAAVLDAGAVARRQAALAIAEELIVERRDAKKDIRSGAVKLAEVMAEASVLERVAGDVRARTLPPLDGQPDGASWDPAVLAALAGPTPTGMGGAIAGGRGSDGPPDPRPGATTVDLGDGRTAWVPDVDTLAAALGVDQEDGEPVEEGPPLDLTPTVVGVDDEVGT